MISISTKIRKNLREKAKKLREKEILPAVLYGPEIKEARPLELNYQDLEGVYKEAGESSLISLEIEGEAKKYPVLIHEVQRDPLTDKIIHVDFYQPSLVKEVEVQVSLIFEGEAPAVKNLGGTLVKNISEVEVKAFPQKLPKEIKVNVEKLQTFEDNILIKDLKLPAEVKILKNPEEIVASVLPPEKIEEELEKPIEEKVEEVKIVREKKEEKEGEEEKKGIEKTK